MNKIDNNSISISDNDILTAKMESRLKQIQKEKRNYWKEEEELILKDWADKAQCYEWMHLKAHEKYKSKKTWFTIPVIIISTITGTANFAQERFGQNMVQYVVMVIGTLNLIAAIITTVYQFLKISELNESYRMSALSWGKYYRVIKTELLKHPLDRKSHEHIVKYASEEYDRLIEISPLIPKNIIKKFNTKFKLDPSFKKPEICTNQFVTDIYTMTIEERQGMINELFEDEERRRQELLNELDDARHRADTLQLAQIETEESLQQQLEESENKLRESQYEIQQKRHELENITRKLLETIETNNYLSRTNSEQELTNDKLINYLDNDDNTEQINEFKETFQSIHGRIPDNEEIKDIMKLINKKQIKNTLSNKQFINIDYDFNNNNNNNNNINSINDFNNINSINDINNINIIDIKDINNNYIDDNIDEYNIININKDNLISGINSDSTV